MPRPSMSTPEIDAVRRRLLETTGKIIAREGYDAFSMRRLGKEAGMSASALYRYFPARRNVLIAYWLDTVDELTRRCEAVRDQDVSPVDKLQAVLCAYADFAIEDRDRFRVFFIENDKGQFSDLVAIDAAVRPYRLFVEIVGAAIAAGKIRPLPSATAAQILWGSVHGVLTLAITINEIDFGDVRRLAEITALTALRGLAVSDKDKPNDV
ncbi:hypothetical protein CCR94_00330 [Rhodoblastus sphagnicola]|uniref:Uncharacterized protein n=2 Tax=Rhodoblastus sphagnicola TaxID=333368 RepID=A0A2S6NH92_9HYPH|nr:TetR/AcrR family transcriptional regulator [Rhodoblastus sphagnicola]MBB4200863.1 AcrR family transcriptional regulator [Rhodoblastus sphagnicola]PPQ33986.1 hypothetical protein CCR94_00330 [Rhodoblastus sphagnicola]